MTPREEYQAAYREAQHASARVERLLEPADNAILKEIDGWRKREVLLIGGKSCLLEVDLEDNPKNSFDMRTAPRRREIGEAISAWYSAMSLVEIKWGGFRHAEPQATDLKEPDFLTR